MQRMVAKYPFGDLVTLGLKKHIHYFNKSSSQNQKSQIPAY